jgi:sugar phosphate permease
MTSLPKPLARAAPRIFYGWLVVLIAFCGSFISAGTGGYIFGQFIQPLSQTFGWSVGFVSSILLVRSLTNIAVVPLVGKLTDRVGSRPVMLIGSLIGGALFVALAWVAEPVLFYLGYSVVWAAANAMIGGIPPQAAVTRWFRRRRGLALSLVTLGISTGGVVMVPLTQVMLDNYGWRFALGVVGVGILVVMLPPVFLFMRDYPEQLGLKPDGEGKATSPAEPDEGAGARAGALAHDEREWTSAQILRSPLYWQQAIGYMFAFAMLQVTLVHQYPFITHQGFDGETAALVLSIYALSAGVSKFVWGFLADRMDVYKVAAVSNWLAALGIVVLMFANTLPLLWLYAVVGGWGIGGLPALQAIVLARSFGRRSYGTVAGLLNPMNSIAAAVAVPFAGYMFDLTGTYVPAFGVIVAATVVSSVSLLFMSRTGPHARAVREPV